jgi:hypothetical protein
MIAAVDAANTAPAPDATLENADKRPEGLPEGFDSWEDLAKAYTEQQAKLNAPADKDKTTTEEPAKDPNTATEEDADKALSAAGLDLNEFSQEFDAKGELSPESYEKLAKAGYPQAVVDQYIAGQQALAQQFTAQVFSVAGGEDAYTEMVTWAKTNMSAAEVEAYNKAVSGGLEEAKLAVSGLRAKFEGAVGSEPNLLQGGKAAAADVFESTAQVTTAMRDKRYSTDPAYRAQVQAKLQRSNVF